MKEDEYQHMGEGHAQRTAYLVAGYLRQTLTEKEHDELDEWITANDDNQRLFEELTDPDFLEKGFSTMDNSNKEAVLKRIKTKLEFTNSGASTKKRRFFYYGIAASLLLIAGVFLINTFMNKQGNSVEPSATNTIKPGGNYALLTLPNGQTIKLDEARNGLIDSSNGVEVLKTNDGQLSYESINSGNKDYHILSTPTGGQYNVQLPDGSRVWLNSSSSLKYPVAFNGNERVVELKGEGYFEVNRLTPSPSPGGEGKVNTPFIVKLNGIEVEVLGTHFNINAYDDEATVNTSLLEGKVVVRSRQLPVGSQQPAVGSRQLAVGEQAKIDKEGKIEVINVNTQEVIAWKNGQFMFKDAPIENVMRQIARWYGAEIVYEGKVSYHFNATIFRNEEVSRLLKVLEETNRVHFKIDGKKIVVKE